MASIGVVDVTGIRGVGPRPAPATGRGSGRAVDRRPAGRAPGGLRLTRRGRVVVALLALLLAAPVVGWGARAVADAPGAPLEVRVHAVQPGETLWGYAEQVAERGDDLRDVVAHLQAINDLATAELQVGQIVLLPVG